MAGDDHWLEDTIGRCHPSNVPRLTADLEAARRGEGTTLFDWLVEIIERHGPGGSEARTTWSCGCSDGARRRSGVDSQHVCERVGGLRGGDVSAR
jgi:hypothetical protein